MCEEKYYTKLTKKLAGTDIKVRGTIPVERVLQYTASLLKDYKNALELYEDKEFCALERHLYVSMEIFLTAYCCRHSDYDYKTKTVRKVIEEIVIEEMEEEKNDETYKESY